MKKILLNGILLLTCASWCGDERYSDDERIGLQDFIDANSGCEEGNEYYSSESCNPNDTSKGPPDEDKKGTYMLAGDSKD